MGRAIRSPRADLDIWEIAEYIAAQNVDAAMKFLDEVNETLSRLAQFPGRLPFRPRLRAGQDCGRRLGKWQQASSPRAFGPVVVTDGSRHPYR